MPPPQSSPSASNSDLQTELISLLRRMVPPDSVITAQTRILADLDLDSLKMLELIDALNEKYGVDLLQDPNFLISLRTVETLEAALKDARALG